MSDEYISKEQFVTHFRKLLCEDCNHRKQYRNGKPINRFIYEIGGVMCRACEIDDMLDRVEDFEPADVAPTRRGKWVSEGYYADYTGIEAWRCSCCGGHTIADKSELYHYCPNCGAKMEVTDGTT